MTRAKPDSCAGCACEKHGTDFTAVEGTGSLGVLLCGEASGEMEAREGTPFVRYAPAGSLLERVLRRMSLSREQFSITNCLRCRPRNNWLDGAPWEYSALNHCRSNLNDAIASRRPRAIVALGGIATRELTGMAGEARGVSHLAGYVLRGPNDIPVVCNFHPAFLRRGKASYQGVFARILQRAVNVAAGRDKAWMWGVAPEDRSTRGTLEYITHPSLEDARGFLNRVQASGGVVSYDIETSESASLDEDAREGFADTHISLIQFALGDTAIAMAWERTEFRAIAQAILHADNVKCGHNVWLFDNKVLAAAGAREGLDLTPRGTVHDTLQMFHHWQPDLPAHLQFAASFVSFPFPWKHLAATNIEFYGCCDVDATLRLYTMLEATLRRDGIWGDDTRGYLGQVYAVRPVLAAMEDRGLPIDDAARRALDVEFDAAQRELGAELTGLAADVGRVHPKEGYKGVPPEVKAYLMDIAISNDPDGPRAIIGKLFTESGEDGETYRYHQRLFDVPCVDAVTGAPVAIPTLRWCRVYDFNPNSSQQLLAYMRLRRHPVPKSRDEDEDGNRKDTTNKKELQRLARKTGDTFYLKVIEYRELSKMRGTYIEGFAPGPDSRVHPTFTFDTGTGQIAARNPNATNFPKRMRLAKQVRRMVAAPDGYTLTEFDFKSYHVVTTGYCAEDASYIRMANLDMHSFVAWHMLKLPGADDLITLPDDELAAKLAWFKTDEKRKWLRDNQAKPAILGIGFGMGYRRLYQENMEYFDGERAARKLHDLLHALFPRVFAWQDRVRKLAHDEQKLTSPFGHTRRFYEVFRWDPRKQAYAPGDQAEEAVAFLPANIAFGNIRETMKALAWWKFDSLYGLCNYIHDSFVFCHPEKWIEQIAHDVTPILTAPSKILRNSVAPNGLAVGVEAVTGRNWADTREVKLPAPAAPNSLASSPAPAIR